MKTYMSILTLLLFACSSNKQVKANTSNCDFDDKISDTDKVLNIETYKNELEKNGSFILIENDSIFENISNNSNGYNRRIQNKIKNITKLMNYDTITKKINYSNIYYNKGNFNIGNEYIYNEKGQVIQTINHNQYDKYPICYKEIIKSTEKKAGRKLYFQGLERDSLINKNETEYSWKVYFEDSISKSPTLSHKFFRINAKTGKTITEKIVN